MPESYHNSQANEVGSGLGQVRCKILIPYTIMDKIFKENSRFHVKLGTTEKVKFVSFQQIFASIGKKFILKGLISTKL